MMPRPYGATGVDSGGREGESVLRVNRDDAFAVFFFKDYRKLVIFLTRNGFSVEIARDCASEAMAQAHAAWAEVQTPEAWVRTVARRLAVKEAVRQRGELRRLEEKGWDRLWESTVEPQRRVDDTAELVQLLQLLSEKQRLVMTWRLEGFTTEEIAVGIDMKPQTVRSNLRHAEAKLRSVFEQQNGGGR